MQVINQIR